MKQRTKQDKLRTRQRRLALLSTATTEGVTAARVSSPAAAKPVAKADPESIFGYPVSFMYQDLVRSGVATVIIVGLLLACIWWLR